jgi:uncharacterized protein (DUF58 family)
VALNHPHTVMAPSQLRREAEDLAAGVARLIAAAQRLAAAVDPGDHGRRRPGPGQDFWQYRMHRAEDGARAVDWRRSARSDRLFVRETEWSAPQTALFWCDARPGMRLAQSPGAAQKCERAAVIALALAVLFSRGGERVGPIVGPAPALGRLGVERTARALLTATPPDALNALVRPRAFVVFASDFYDPIDTWAQRLHPWAAAGARAVLLAVCDPAEEDFPFRGRTRFEAPDGSTQKIFGRAEDVARAYRERLAQHRAKLASLADRFGMTLVSHRTDHQPAPALSAVAAHLARTRR